VKALLIELVLKAFSVLLNILVAHFKSEAEKRERQRRADDLNNSKDEDEFDEASRRLP